MSIKPTLTIMMSWHDVRKVWVVDWIQPLPSGVGVSRGKLEINCQEPIDGLAARRIVAAIQTELASWLPFGEMLDYSE